MRETSSGRPSRSTVLLAVAFLATLALHLAVRPAPSAGAPQPTATTVVTVVPSTAEDDGTTLHAADDDGHGAVDDLGTIHALDAVTTRGNPDAHTSARIQNAVV
jgi:hypothetical protein